jgi:hypothetical protein
MTTPTLSDAERIRRRLDLAQSYDSAITETNLEAFEVGLQDYDNDLRSSANPYPVGTIDRLAWDAGFAYGKDEDDRHAASLRWMASRQEAQAAFEKAITPLRERHADDNLRAAAFEWLCENSESRDDFEDEAESSADEHDWPEDEDDEDDE